MNLTEAMETVMTGLSEAIRKETEHRVDVCTDGDWFVEKVRHALCELLMPDAETCEGECSEDLVGYLRRVLVDG
jgi:hypothetical protein